MRHRADARDPGIASTVVKRGRRRSQSGGEVGRCDLLALLKLFLRLRLGIAGQEGGAPSAARFFV